MSAAAQVIKAMAKGAKEGAKKGAASASKTRGGGKADGALDRIDKHIESLLTTPTKGQQKVETAVKSQRVYRQGQNKAGAAGTAAGTAAGAGAMYFMMDVGGEKVSVPADKAKNPDKLKTSDVEILEKKEVSEFEKAFSEAFENGEETFMWNGKEYAVELKAGERTMKAEGGPMRDDIEAYKSLSKQRDLSLSKAEDKAAIERINKRFNDYTKGFDGSVIMKALQELDAEQEKEQARMPKAEGGSLFIPPEMESMPVDTYPNIPEEEMDDVMAAQKPDGVVEEDYVSYVMSEVLSEEEVDYVNSMLEADDKFSQIFDKLILSAAEFQGSGEVEGPGDGTSDDIPARLSDGEFVFTKKATDQLGAETLQSMMDDAERAYDGGLMKKAEEGLLFNPMSAVDDPVAAGDSAQTQLDVQRQMLRANRVPSLIGG
jgi:hypothetical protein